MASPTYRKAKRERLLERSRKGVAARERLRAERNEGEPVREWSCWRRITDESIHRTRYVIEFWSCTDEQGHIKQEIRENGRKTRFRSWRAAIRALARCL